MRTATGSRRRSGRRYLASTLLALFGILALGAAPLAAASEDTAQSASEPADPAGVVRRFDDTLLSAMRQAKQLGYQGRYDLLAPVIGATFDLPTMTRVAVGPSWTGLSEDQQERLIKAFRHFIIATFAKRFDDYGGETFEIKGTTARAGGAVVENDLVKPDGDRVRLDYLARQTEQGWRAVDVYLDGTVSEMAVHRSEFSAILRQSGADGLIALLHERTRQIAID